MNGTAVYNEEDGLWYKSGTYSGGVKAMTYPEAFEKLFGQAPYLPPNKREQRETRLP